MNDDIALGVRLTERRGQSRYLVAKLTVPVKRFRVPDLLSQYGDYPTLKEVIEREIAIVTEKYFRDAEGLIASVLNKKMKGN